MWKWKNKLDFGQTNIKFSVLVARLCPTLCNCIDCSLPGFSIHGIFQVRILERVAISFSKIFPTQGSNPGLLHWRRTLYQLSCQGSPSSWYSLKKKSVSLSVRVRQSMSVQNIAVVESGVSSWATQPFWALVSSSRNGMIQSLPPRFPGSVKGSLRGRY